MSGPLSDPVRLLTAWERGAGSPPVARGAAMVAAAGLVSDQGCALDLPLAACAALVVRAHVETFGGLVACTATCPGCGELIDVTLDLTALPVAPASTATVAVGALTVRALTTRDLLDAGSAEDPRALLLSRCVEGAGGPAATVDDAVDVAAERLAGAAAVVLRCVCPGCGAQVRVGLDPGLLLWEQVSAAAERLLVEVADLAAAYGWSETDVLRLSPMRRAAYRELADR
jgi:hypothetical protein